MLQAGPIVNVHLPKDRVTQTHQGYGFVEFASEEDADYAVKIMNQIRLWGKPIRVNKASADRRGGGPEGAGGFGALVAPPKIARDEANLSKGYGFVSYASFDASDDAIANMHGQYLMNKEVTVQYAFKKDGKGERHGDQAERALAAQAKKNNVEVAIPAMPASLVMPAGAPTGPSGLGGSRPPPSAPQTPYGNFPPGPGQGYAPPPSAPYGYQNGGPPHRPSPQGPGGFGAPPPSQPGMPSRQYNQSPLHAPSNAGLPPRPPPSAAGYGGPVAQPPMGYSNAMPGMPPGGAPPGMPPGFPPSMGYPPQQQR
jgi:splicing factor 3B subunit 4